jgi:hypothetical protein
VPLREIRNDDTLRALASKSLILLVEPDGIEPTTSSMPLLKFVVYSYSGTFLFVPKCLENQAISSHSVSAPFLPIDFRWRFGGDLERLSS